MLGKNLPPPIPVSIGLLLEACALETVLNIKNKTSETWGEGSKLSCSVTSSLKQEILGEKMSVIYILQNVSFSSFPDQASCLEGWGPSFQKSALSLRSTRHLRCRCGEAQWPWAIQASCRLASQGSRQCVDSGPGHLCLLRTCSWVEPLMATLTTQCQFQSWAPNTETGKRK